MTLSALSHSSRWWHWEGCGSTNQKRMVKTEKFFWSFMWW